MKGLKLFCLILILVIMVLGGWFHQAGLTVEYTVLNGSYYSEMLAESGLIGELHSKIQREVAGEIAGQVPREAALLISEAIFSVFNVDWLEDQLIMVIEDWLRFMKGEQQDFKAVIELEAKKAELEARLNRLLSILPERVMAEAGIESGMEAQFAAGIMEEMDLPDQIRLDELLSEEEMIYELAEFSRSVQQFRFLYIYLPFAAYILLLIFNLLLAGWAGGLKWFGSGLIASGITFLAGMQLTSFALAGPVASSLSTEEAAFAEAIIAAASYTAARASMIPVIYTLAGLFFLVIGLLSGFIISRRTGEGQF